MEETALILMLTAPVLKTIGVETDARMVYKQCYIQVSTIAPTVPTFKYS